jgi:hypothetical protein
MRDSGRGFIDADINGNWGHLVKHHARRWKLPNVPPGFPGWPRASQQWHTRRADWGQSVALG